MGNGSSKSCKLTNFSISLLVYFLPSHHPSNYFPTFEIYQIHPLRSLSHPSTSSPQLISNSSFDSFRKIAHNLILCTNNPSKATGKVNLMFLSRKILTHINSIYSFPLSPVSYNPSPYSQYPNHIHSLLFAQEILQRRITFLTLAPITELKPSNSASSTAFAPSLYLSLSLITVFDFSISMKEKFKFILQFLSVFWGNED